MNPYKFHILSSILTGFCIFEENGTQKKLFNSMSQLGKHLKLLLTEIVHKAPN